MAAMSLGFGGGPADGGSGSPGDEILSFTGSISTDSYDQFVASGGGGTSSNGAGGDGNGGSDDSGGSNNNPCGMCVYMNDAGTAPDKNAQGVTTGVDQNSNQNECAHNGGFFVDESTSAKGNLTVYYDPNSNNLYATTTGEYGGVYGSFGQPGQLDRTSGVPGNILWDSEQANWQAGLR